MGGGERSHKKSYIANVANLALYIKYRVPFSYLEYFCSWDISLEAVY